MASQPCWDLVTGNHIVVENKTGSSLRLLGRNLTDLEVWRLSRSLDGATVSVEVPQNEEGTIGRLLGYHPEIYGSASLQVIKHFRAGNGTELVLQNHGYFLNARHQGTGLAWAALALQIEVAHDLGFSRIELHAMGQHPAYVFPEYEDVVDPENMEELEESERDLTPRVGALQWPKFGFDGVVRADIWDAMPSQALERLGLKRGDRLSTLLATPGGRRLWKYFHAEMMMTLDLRPLSDGAKRLLAYASEKPTTVRT